MKLASIYTPLRVHSHFSLLRGTEEVETLCQAAAARGFKALALTDTDSVAAAIDFWREAQAAGLAPVLGAEVTVPGELPVTLLVQSTAGWRRLCHILSARHAAPARPVGGAGAFSLRNALLEDRRGLVLLAADPGLLDLLARETGPEDLYVALDRHGPRQSLLAFAHRRGLPPVAAPRVFFLDPGRHALHRLLRAIDLNTTLARLPEVEVAPPLAWLMPAKEIQRAFVDCPEAVERSSRLARQCTLAEPPWRGPVFPTHRGMNEAEAQAELGRLCIAGMARRYARVTAAHRQRLEKEMALVAEKSFASYFLVVHDIVSRWPRTCGRGSAAASLISYALGITHVDPVHHDLFFERFLNSGRIDPPDIDVDFAWDERDEVLDSVFARYGRERAAMVCTVIRFRGRAAVREIAKVYGLPEDEIAAIGRRLARTWSSTPVEEMVRRHPLFADLELRRPWPEILSWAARLEGLPRHLSVHPGGVVIVPTSISDHVPMQPSAKGVNIIQWDKDAAEDGGLVKIDLLGNRSLAVIRDALTAVRTHQGVDIPYASFNPLEDRRTVEALAAGDTVGVFYVESPAMRQLQKKTGHGDFEHLVIHSSIIRPAANAYIREYIRRLHGGRYQPLHPLLQELMPATYGIMVYQEDVARIAIAMAGFSAAQADDLRKVLSRKHRVRQLRDYHRLFLSGAAARDFPPAVVQAVWEMILSFAGYSFCKPHSASYALVSFKSAYLKAHYPAEFMAAVLSNQGGYYSTFAYISECRRLGLTVDLPDVNASAEAYSGRDGRVRIGLMQIRGLSAAARHAVVAGRRQGPYRSFDSFLRRVVLNPADLRLLIRAGAFDAVAGNQTRPQLTWQALEWERQRGRGTVPHSGQDGMAGHRPGTARRGRAGGGVHRGRRAGSAAPLLPIFDEPLASLPASPPPDQGTVLRQEVETLGFLVSRHPLTLYREQMRRLPIVDGKDLHRHTGRRVLTVGWYVTGKVVGTKGDETMEFVSFEDTTALYETTLFPDAYRKFCRMLSHARPYLLRGKVEEDFGAISLTVENLRFLDEAVPQRKARAASG